MDFAGKRVLVTGGTRGIGRATVEAFLAAGARVAVNGRTAESTNKALGELRAGDRAIAAPGDVGRPDDCRRLVANAVQGLGGLDVLVNNAGWGGSDGPIDRITVEEWDRTININLRGTFLCIQAALPTLRQSRGNIVNVASVLGIRGNGVGNSDYCASKGGVVNLTRDLSIELGPEVRVNCLCPGAIDTDMLKDLGRVLGEGDVATGYKILSDEAPLKMVAKPEDMAGAILFLASDKARFVTGAIFVADGGIVGKI
jgi:NAD(P)-dependent dehydrogenase (short-subunit alcohol dehydrogenase family)